MGEEHDYGFIRLGVKQLFWSAEVTPFVAVIGKPLACLTLPGTGRNIQFGYPNDCWPSPQFR